MLQDPKFAANWRTIVSPKRDRSQPGPPPQLPGRVRIAMDGSDVQFLLAPTRSIERVSVTATSTQNSHCLVDS